MSAINLSPELEEEVLRVFRQTRSPFKTQKKTGVDISAVFALIARNREQLAAAQERHGGMGRPELQDFIVGRRKAIDRGWNNDDHVIAEARINYERGTHIMVTGRDGQWLLLYSIPRQGRAEPLPGYFIPEKA